VFRARSKQPRTTDKVIARPKRRRRIWRILVATLVVLAVILIGVRLALPTWLRWYVNRTIDRSTVYQGTIGDVDIHLLTGGYTIRDIQLSKVTGNVPVPFFTAKRLDLHLEWNALLHGKLVGQVVMVQPELNFVDSKDAASSQTSGGGPWLQVLSELFPFDINSCIIKNGAIHFRAFDTNPPVDVYLASLHADIENLTNIHHDTAPLVTSVKASALAMGQAKFEFEMKLNPFSYKPSFELAVRLIGLDVTQINGLTQAYGDFDFKRGTFDLVTELNARAGTLQGYVKPLFRRVQVFSLKQDIQNDNPLQFFWQALVGVTSQVFKNQQRDQLATLIPVSGSLEGPQTDILSTVGNVLKNAFIRAYLPRFEKDAQGGGAAQDIDGLEFGPGTNVDSASPITQ
jgi:uncharacterized protein involved in outer membrane biogenesis